MLCDVWGFSDYDGQMAFYCDKWNATICHHFFYYCCDAAAICVIRNALILPQNCKIHRTQSNKPLWSWFERYACIFKKKIRNYITTLYYSYWMMFEILIRDCILFILETIWQ